MEIESISPPLQELVSKTDPTPDAKGTDYNEVAANHIIVNKASFENKESYSDSTTLAIRDLFVVGDGFVITKKHLDNPSSFFKIDHIEGYMDHAAVHINEFRNAVEVNDLSFNSTEKRIEIDLVTVDNKLSRYQYIAQFQKETDWIELQQGSIAVNGMDFESYFHTGAIKAKKLSIKD